VNLKFWQKALKEAERQLEVATTRRALNAGGEKKIAVRAGRARRGYRKRSRLALPIGGELWMKAVASLLGSTPGQCITDP
jgi:hypothetical protein